MNVKKELGKWLMDIAKYITTAVLLAAVFGNLQELWLVCLFASIAILLTLGGGLWLIHDEK